MAGVYGGRSLKRGSGKVFLPRKGGKVLGNTKSFFSAQKMLQDTPGFFTTDKIPDTPV